MSDGGERDSLAPVIPLFGGPLPENPGDGGEQSAPDEGAQAAVWNATWAETPAHALSVVDTDDTGDDDSTAQREAAANSLLRKLRSRSLSLREARSVLVQTDLPADQVDDVTDAFVRRGYLDDAALAEQLMHAAVDRKGQGRQVIAQTLAKRGIPRDVADAAIDELPDDDADRALEYARTKARSLASLDHDTALRRLMGQLARRGYPGSVAMNAAKLALSEAGSSRSGVRFR
jgi:regulatory protein